jgi:hypothetical protein
METSTAIILAVIVVAALIGLALFMRQRRTTQLRSQFGPEYERTVEETGARSKAEAALATRAKRVERFDIHPLRTEDRSRFDASWRQVQAEFVDDPRAAVGHADQLLGEVMQARGYPVTDFEQRSEDLSVDHPAVVQNYRAAHDIAVRHARGEAGTEDLRQAMIHYRALFDDLVAEAAPQPRAARAAAH